MTREKAGGTEPSPKPWRDLALQGGHEITGGGRLRSFVISAALS